MLKSPSGIQKQLSAAIAIIGQQDFPGEIFFCFLTYLLTMYLLWFHMKIWNSKFFGAKIYWILFSSNCKQLVLPCPFTSPKMFCAGPNFLSQPKNLTAFSASSKLLCRHKNQFCWMQIIFLSGTKNLDQHKTFWDQ